MLIYFGLGSTGGNIFGSVDFCHAVLLKNYNRTSAKFCAKVGYNPTKKRLDFSGDLFLLLVDYSVFMRYFTVKSSSCICHGSTILSKVLRSSIASSKTVLFCLTFSSKQRMANSIRLVIETLSATSTNYSPCNYCTLTCISTIYVNKRT